MAAGLSHCSEQGGQTAETIKNTKRLGMFTRDYYTTVLPRAQEQRVRLECASDRAVMCCCRVHLMNKTKFESHYDHPLPTI